MKTLKIDNILEQKERHCGNLRKGVANKMNISELKGVCRVDYYPGETTVEHCTLDTFNQIETPVGKLVPQYSYGEARRKHEPSLSFYKSGALKRIALETQEEIETPMGVFPAELILFYESGAIRRIFPLNGKLTGFWSENDERALSKSMKFKLDVGAFECHVISIGFHESGELKSIGLWPGEVIVLRTNAGVLPVRNGFSLYESGAIRSLEPPYPLEVMTAIGGIEVFDPDANAVQSDIQSLMFDEEGNIIAFKMTNYKLLAFYKGAETQTIESAMLPHPLSDQTFVKAPLSVKEDENGFEIFNGKATMHFPKETRFVVLKDYTNGQVQICNIMSDV